MVDDDSLTSPAAVKGTRLAIFFSTLHKDREERGMSKWHLHHLHQSVPNHMLRGEKSFKLAQVEVYVQLKAGQKQH